MKHYLLTTILTLTVVTIALGVPSAFANQRDTHIPGVFIGYTTTKDETHFTLGVEYTYKFDDHWGMGAVYEETENMHHGDGIQVAVASLFYYPVHDLKFGVGIGHEKFGGQDPHSERVYRLSVAYDIHVAKIEVEPLFAIDLVDGQADYVLGIGLAWPFE